MPFTRRTLARLAETIADQFGHAQISNLFFEYSVDAHDPGAGSNRATRSLALVRAIEAGQAEIVADEALVELANRSLANEYARQNHIALLASLALDGFEWGVDSLVPAMPVPSQPSPQVSALERDLDGHGLQVAGPFQGDRTASSMLLPEARVQNRRSGAGSNTGGSRHNHSASSTLRSAVVEALLRDAWRLTTEGSPLHSRNCQTLGAAPASRGSPPFTLERDLDGHGLQVAATHYRQAIDNFVDGNLEAANGQLRSFLEALFRDMGVSNGAQANVGANAAVLHLRNVGHLDDAECQFLRGLWASAQDNGPHAGLSNEEEARFRLHASTAAARYILRKGN